MNVHAVIATYRRPELLRRVLDSMRGQGTALTGVVVVNNGGDAETREVAEKWSPVPATVVTPAMNLGSAGGIAAGMQAATGRDATHFWVMDDDAAAMPGALTAMLAALTATKAAAVTALIVDEHGIVRWFPGPLPQPAWDVIRSGVTPAEFVTRCGQQPLRWSWATWASIVITRSAVETVGLPDARLWYQGTDIEYTLRLSQGLPCVLAPAAVCQHFPPAQSGEIVRIKELWSLQNGAFVAVRLRHGRRIVRHLPGNHFRYWRRNGFSLVALVHTVGAFWRGAVCGRPVGLEEYTRPLSRQMTSR